MSQLLRISNLTAETINNAGYMIHKYVRGERDELNDLLLDNGHMARTEFMKVLRDTPWDDGIPSEDVFYDVGRALHASMYFLRNFKALRERNGAPFSEVESADYSKDMRLLREWTDRYDAGRAALIDPDEIF